MTDNKYLPVIAVDDLIYGLEGALLTVPIDNEIKANSCFDLLMNIAEHHPEEQVREYMKTQLKQIEGVE